MGHCGLAYKMAHDGTMKGFAQCPMATAKLVASHKCNPISSFVSHKGITVVLIRLGQSPAAPPNPHSLRTQVGAVVCLGAGLPVAGWRSNLECPSSSSQLSLRRSQIWCRGLSQTRPGLVGCTGAAETMLPTALRPLSTRALPKHQRSSAGSADADC